MSSSDCQALWQGFEQVAASLERADENWHCLSHWSSPWPSTRCVRTMMPILEQCVAAAACGICLLGKALPLAPVPQVRICCQISEGGNFNDHHWTKSDTTAKPWQRLSWNALLTKSLRVVGFHQWGTSTAWHSVLVVISNVAAGGFVLC